MCIQCMITSSKALPVHPLVKNILLPLICCRIEILVIKNDANEIHGLTHHDSHVS